MQPLPLSKLYLINLPHNIHGSEGINLLFSGVANCSEIMSRKSSRIFVEFRIQSRNRKLYRKQSGMPKQFKSGHDSPSRIEKDLVQSASFISL